MQEYVVAIVPEDAPFEAGRERPRFVKFGGTLPTVAVYADQSEVEAPHQHELAERIGLPRHTHFSNWRRVGEDDESFRVRCLPSMEYSMQDGRWCVRLDWGRAYVTRDRNLMGTAEVKPLGRKASVRVRTYPGQPRHSVDTIRILARLVAGEPVGEPRDEEEALDGLH